MESRSQTIPRQTTSKRRRARPAATQPRTIADAFTQDESSSVRGSFGFLDEGRLDELKTRAFDLLADYGVVIVHPVAAAAFKKAGAKPGNQSDRLRLPRELVEEALAATPKRLKLCGKRPALDIDLPRPDGGFIARTGTGAHGYVDPRTAKYRNLDLDAVDEMAAVASGLDEVGFIAHPFVHGVPELTSDIHSYARLISRTDKHVWMQPYNKENVDYLMRIAAIAAGGEAALRARPLTSVITCSFSPLEFKFMDSEVIIQAGVYGVPSQLAACPRPAARRRYP
ncbi:MAG: trimethylamine methyltransferase family protein, partial [Proteobacteria bacterium]|nr:trimethylamine methyltransferase family protein [Pseudomonadota bacterium]